MDNKVNKKRINEHLEYDWYKYLIILIVGIALFYFVFSQINSTRDYEDVNFFVSCYSNGRYDFENDVLREMRSSRYDADKYGENVLREVKIEVQDPLGKNYSTLLATHGVVSSDVIIMGEWHAVSVGYRELDDELLSYILPDAASADDFEYLWAFSDGIIRFAGNGAPQDGLKRLREGDYYLDLDTHNVYCYKDSQWALLHENVAVKRAGIKVSKFSRMHGAGSAFETDWRNTGYKDEYGDKEESSLPSGLDDVFYLVINPSSVNIGKFGKKSKDANAQALFCAKMFITYYAGYAD